MCYRRAVALNPQSDMFWGDLAVFLETHSFNSVDDKLLQDLLYLLEQSTTGPSGLNRPIISALRCHRQSSQLFELAAFKKPEIEIAYGRVAEQLSEIPIFLRIIQLTPIYDLGIERMLTFMRRAMLKETLAGKIHEKSMQFATALALHCFTNEYIFPETDEENVAVEQLQEEITMLLAKERDVPPSFIATLGAYRPLYKFLWAQKLCKQKWENNVKEVINRQIREPLEEISLRSQIPQLTAIQDAVSQSVREQYEENPYPRWIKTGLRVKGTKVNEVVKCSGVI